MKTVVLSLLTFALVGISVAQERDQALEDAVRAALESEKLDEEVAEVVAIDGNVTLRGKPSNAYVKMKAIEVALGVEGVEGVEDELEVAQAESPQELAQALVNRVLTYPNLTVFDDVNFQIEGPGIVVMTGWVTEPFKKDDLGKRVASVTGVTELNNVIEVLPVGGSDDRLRRALFDNIYGHQMFIQYRNRAHPPIRLIVNRGRVILSGAVRNRIEQRQAETIARSTFGVIAVDNRLQVRP